MCCSLGCRCVMTSCLNPNSFIAKGKVYNDPVSLYKDSLKMTNWIIWFIQTWEFDVELPTYWANMFIN